jgi:hypothetical protein
MRLADFMCCWLQDKSKCGSDHGHEFVCVTTNERGGVVYEAEDFDCPLRFLVSLNGEMGDVLRWPKR